MPVGHLKSLNWTTVMNFFLNLVCHYIVGDLVVSRDLIKMIRTCLTDLTGSDYVNALRVNTHTRTNVTD